LKLSNGTALRRIAQAAHWARLAADQGHPRAQALLGYLYETGKGLPLDYVSAYTWYSRAVAAGDDSSAEHLKSLSQIMTRRQLDQANSLVSAQSISRQPDSAPSSPAGLSLLPNP
jgi:TPR repeat protein